MPSLSLKAESWGNAFRVSTSLRASSPVWASETGLARTRVLARLASLAQIGELARRLGIYLCPCGLHFRMVSIFYNHAFPLSL